MIKTSILKRISALGGDVTQLQGRSLSEDLLLIHLPGPLYPRPSGVPWSDNPEPIYGLGQYVEENLAHYKNDKDQFFKMMVNFFFDTPEGHYGQTYFTPQLFTPLTPGTQHYDEWHMDFENEKEVDLSLFKPVATSWPIEFIELTHSDSYPDTLYVCASDPKTDNPRVFGTDHEVFFSDVSDEGTLEDFFNKFMTKEEFLAIVVADMADHYQ
ncbi:hypothetical protein [Agarilytica rhodophyticola]|uniref:hypothetical protein n=1 Tax=Agarilytica rhodophyticola TaxID=1737490 RepID=UPI000B347F0D|nr:hypothetical protein [Agarilytica rhodophyticola]